MALLSGLLATWSLFWRAVLERCGRIIPPFQPLILALIPSFGHQTNGNVALDENVRAPAIFKDQASDLLLTGLQKIPLPKPIMTFTHVNTKPVIPQSKNQKLLLIGIWSETYLVDETIIRKAPRTADEEGMMPIIREAAIYNILKGQPRIAECIPQERTDIVDIKYYPYGDVLEFCQRNEVSAKLKSKWFHQIIEAIAVIHSFDVIHSDLALRQFFVDDELNIRLGDFGASQYPDHPALGYEKATHCLPRDYALPNTVASDLFALGSTLHELLTGKVPYSELYPEKEKDMLKAREEAIWAEQRRRERLADHDIEQRYISRQFPDTSHLMYGDIIIGFWDGTITSAEEGLNRLTGALES